MFVAAWPDSETKERLGGLDLGEEKGLRPVGPDRWHVTLRFLGEVDEALVPGLSAALRTVAAAVPGPVRCRLGPATAWFTGVRVLQLPATGLDALAAAVREATLPLVPPWVQDEPPFNGHLTLARAKGRRRAAPVARAPWPGSRSTRPSPSTTSTWSARRPPRRAISMQPWPTRTSARGRDRIPTSDPPDRLSWRATDRSGSGAPGASPRPAHARGTTRCSR